jgi:hypothetical protein
MRVQLAQQAREILGQSDLVIITEGRIPIFPIRLLAEQGVK